MTQEEGADGPLDLADPDLYGTRRHLAVWEALLRSGRPHWSPPGHSPSGFWSVFSYDACLQVMNDADSFTSRYGMLIGFDADHPDRGGQQMVVASEGTQHTKLRRALGTFFSPRRLLELEAFTRRDVRARLLSPDPLMDVAHALAPAIPATVTCELLGVPHADRQYLTELTERAFAAPDSAGLDPSQIRDAHTQIFLYFDELVQSRLDHPGTGAINGLLHAGLDRNEVLVNCYNLLIGGNQTTRHAVSAVFHLAALHPEMLDRWARPERDLAEDVEELLRWSCPGMHFLRVTTEDVFLEGQRIERGQPVVAWIGAANRDPNVFSDPTAFMPGRAARQLTFGGGIHSCLGSRLARIELRIVMQTLGELYASVGLARQPRYARSNLIQGYDALPVLLTSREFSSAIG